MIVTANDIISTLLSMGDEWQRENLMRFFKTGKECGYNVISRYNHK